MPDLRRQCGAASASCAGVQSRQLPAHASDAGADQGLVADQPEGEADQDRREGRQPRPLRRLPDGRGRHPTANVPGDFAADRGTTAAATTCASMRRATVMRSCQPTEECVQMPAKMVRSAPRPPFGAPTVAAVVRATSPYCQNAAKAQQSTPVRGSSGEPRLMRQTRLDTTSDQFHPEWNYTIRPRRPSKS